MDDLSRISLKYLWQVIRLRWRLVAVLSTLLLSGAAAYILNLQPLYTADSVVLLAPLTEQLTDSSSADRPASMTDPFFIRSEAAILSSDSLCRAVIAQLHLDESPEFAPRPGLRQRLGLPASLAKHPFLSDEQVAQDRVLRLYHERLSVFNDGRSKTVVVSFTASDPRWAAKIANAHAEAYLREQSARRTGSEQKAIEWLKQEVDARAIEVRDADARVQRYRLKNKIVSSHDGTIVEQRLSQLNGQLVEARRDLSTREAQLAEIRRIRAGGDPSSVSTALEDGPLTDLLRSRVQAEATLASLQSRLAPTNPALLKQRQELISINGVLETQLQRVQSDSESAVRSSQRQVDDLMAAVYAETASKENQDRVTAVLPTLLAESGVKHTVFETVLNRYQTRLAEHAFAEPTASIVSLAEPPARPSFPKTPLFLTVALMCALLGGVSSAALVQMFRPIPRGLNAIADAVGIRPLVAIPRFRNASRVRGVIKMKDPRLFIESIRSVRNAIFEQGSRQTKICLLTSILPSQGKTLVAMSLARALARGGARTIFMEMDLRRPSASALARVQPPLAGVAAVLEGRARVEDVLIRDESSGLDMLLAEKHAGNSLDHLTILTAAQLLARLRNLYDAIIIDSPPIGVVSDALILASLVDQTVLVSKENETSLAELASGTRLLKDRGANVAGLILNNVDPAGLSSVDKTTLHRYVMGVPSDVESLATRRLKRAAS
jgi:capsular exopolysaccharide synthesis family protein